MSDADFQDDPNAPTERQLLVKTIEQMIRKTGDVYWVMELDQICMLSDENERLRAVLALKNKLLVL